MKKFLTIGLILFVAVVVIGIIAIVTAPKSERVIKPEAPRAGVEAAPQETTRKVAPVQVVTPSPTPEVIQVSNQGQPLFTQQTEKKLAPMRAYTATNIQPAPAPDEEVGDIAPFATFIKCKLTFTVDSDSESPPIDGQVTDDVVYRGKTIIRKCSEVHGRAIVDKDRERILGPGVWTFILAEKDGLGLRELVVKGEAMDREDDPGFFAMVANGQKVDTFKGTWGITNGSMGLRGVVIKTANMDVIGAFVAAFIGGIAGTVTQFSTVIAPEQGGQNLNLPSYVAAPAAQGIASVMNTYAAHVMNSIEKDGFFIRVPAGKYFYVRIAEDLDSAKATVGGSRRIRMVQDEYLEDRVMSEKVTQPRKDREEKKKEQSPQMDSLNGATQQLEQLQAKRAQELQTESQQQANPIPTP